MRGDGLKAATGEIESVAAVADARQMMIDFIVVKSRKYGNNSWFPLGFFRR